MIIFFLLVAAFICYMALTLYVLHQAIEADIVYGNKKRMWTFIGIALLMFALPFSVCMR